MLPALWANIHKQRHHQALALRVGQWLLQLSHSSSADCCTEHRLATHWLTCLPSDLTAKYSPSQIARSRCPALLTAALCLPSWRSQPSGILPVLTETPRPLSCCKSEGSQQNKMCQPAAGPFYRAAGMTYLRYANICADLLRNVLKEPAKTKAMQRGAIYFRSATFHDGKQGPQGDQSTLYASGIVS